MQITILHQAVSADAAPDEQDVLQQVAAVRQALLPLGHRVSTIPCTLDLAALDRQLQQHPPDLVFNLVESLAGAGRLIHLPPFLLDARHIPYTGCSAEAIYLTSHKLLAKEKLRAAALPTPAWVSATPSCQATAPDASRTWLVKSLWEHASLGMDDGCLLNNTSAQDVAEQLPAFAQRMGGACFAEAYIHGREFNLGLLAGPTGPQLLPPAEIVFDSFPKDKPHIVGYQAKWATDSFEYQHTNRRFACDASDDALLATMGGLALQCWALFGLAGYARVDFRVDAQGHPWILEVNANPCISPDAGFAAMLTQAGISYEQAVARIVADTRPQVAPSQPAPFPTPAARTTAGTSAPATPTPATATPAPATPATTFRYELTAQDPDAIAALVAATGFFHDDEVLIAKELAQERLHKGGASGYEFVMVEQHGRLVGYSCFGPIPCTATSFDLYWIAVHPDLQGQGMGRILQTETERCIRTMGGTRVYAETSSRPQYASTRAFYERTGYHLAEMLADFYAPGDGRATFLKVL
jgi:D-alanine-D-alanine ligase-like ATP-grasp enzyme/ribosomal protein S18 acetylase RimI-like enzyme